MVKNPPADAGDAGSVSGPGRFHKPRGKSMSHKEEETPTLALEKALTQKGRSAQSKINFKKKSKA